MVFRLHWTIHTFALLVTATVMLTGCMDNPKLTSDEVHYVTLTIDFDGETPALNPGLRTVWVYDTETGTWSNTTEPSEGQDKVTIWVFENMGIYNITVYGALLRAAEVMNFSITSHTERYGVFIDAIAGVENGHDDHHWQYWVNGEYGSLAADKYAVHHGDEIRWEYMGNPFD